METTERLSKAEALKRYENLMDARLGLCPSIERARRLAAIVAPAGLKAFSQATGHLAWPESYGQTPWETATLVGFALRWEEENPLKRHWAAELVDAYRAARASCSPEVPAAC